MKTITNILILVLSLTLISGCMPASFTKWKQNAPTTKKPTSVFQDSNGNPIPSDTLSFPSYIDYHPIGMANPFPISTQMTATATFKPYFDGDLSGGYPFNSKGQSLSPTFSKENPSICGITPGFEGALSDISINTASGEVSLASGILTTVAERQYCLKLTYKRPSSVKPGYTLTSIPAILRLYALDPIGSLDFKQSEHLILKLSSRIELDQFTRGSTITASSGAVAQIDHYDDATGTLYVTATTTSSSVSFRPDDGLRVNNANSIGAPQFDAKVESVINIYPKVRKDNKPNIRTFPLSATLSANRVTFSISPAPTAPFGSFTASGTLELMSTQTAPQTVVISARNDLSTTPVQHIFQYQVAEGYYPPSALGELLYPHSATVSIELATINGSFGDFTAGANVSTLDDNTVTGQVISTNTEASGKRSVLVAMTASGTQGFRERKLITVGSTQAIIAKVINIINVNSADNILSFSGGAFAPYWTNGTSTNSLSYSFDYSPSADTSFIKEDTSSGIISGFSPLIQNFTATITAANSFGFATSAQHFSFMIKGGSPDGAAMTMQYVQTKVASCTSRIKLELIDALGTRTFTGDELKALFPLTNKVFSRGGGAATPTYLDPQGKFLLANINSGYFLPSEYLDSHSATYTVPRAKITRVINVLEKNQPLCAGQIAPVITPSGTVASYSISPDLPSASFGLSFNTTTGELSGTPTTEVDGSISYVVKATSAASVAEAPFYFSVATSPKALSYTRQAIIEVDSGSEFTSGSSISSVDLPSVTGIVREKVTVSGKNYLIVDVTNGQFKADTFVDKYIPYRDPRATILSVQPNTFKFNYIGGPAPSSTDIGNHIVSGTAHGVITLVDAGNSAVYLRLVKGSFSDTGTFCILPASTATLSCATTPYTITNIEAQALSLQTTAGGTFSLGDNILSSNGVNTTSLLITNLGATSLDVITQSFKPLDTGYSLYPPYPLFAAARLVNGVSSLHLLTMYQGETVSISPTLLEGEGLTYSYSGALPVGLSLDPKTGVISGTVENSNTGTSTLITVTAENPMGSTSHSFYLKSFRHMQVSVSMPEAPSIVTHKEGRANEVTPCRITWDQLSSVDIFNRDILCRVEAGELDLRKEGLKLSIFAGKNMCEKLTFVPYFFNRRATGATVDVAYQYNCSCSAGVVDHPAKALGMKSCKDVTNIAGFALRTGQNYYRSSYAYVSDVSKICQYNYDSTTNCDEGELTIHKRAFVDDPATGTCTSRADAGYCTTEAACKNGQVACGGTATPTEGTWVPSCMEDTAVYETAPYACGGERWNCIEGAAKDILKKTEFQAGMRGYITAAMNGHQRDYIVSSPLSKGFQTNIHVANYTKNNSCANANNYNYWASKWDSYATNTLSNLSPWGDAQPFYRVLCQKEDGTIKARIRLQVREWNVAFNVFDDIDTIVPTAGTPTYGVGGSMDTAALDLDMGGSYNNYLDWDDSYNGGAGALNNCNTGAFGGAGYPFPGENL